MSDLSAEVTVTVTLEGRIATVDDVQSALDTMRREGLPPTTEIEIYQHTDVEYVEDVPYSERPRSYKFRAEAKRAAR